MKEYPKVPRYDHPIVESDWLDEDTIILEKYDGSNFRFAIYDEYFEEYCSVDNAEFGDFIIGSSSVWRPESEVDEFQDTLRFGEKLEHIRSNVDKKELMSLNSNYESPLIIFAENMVRHTLEYDWDNVPPLIAYDIYIPKLDNSKFDINRPYKEGFEGFLDWNEVVNICSSVLNIKSARHINTGIQMEDLNTDMIGKSEFSDDRAEGYVIRNDKLSKRIKIRTPEFKEMNKKIWGSNIDDNSPESKKIAYKFATNTRIKKKTKDIMEDSDSGINEEMLYDITELVVDDIWEEEWQVFCHKEFIPSDIYLYVSRRVQGTLIRPNIFGIPDETEDVAKEWEFNMDRLDTKEIRNPEEHIISMVNEDDMKNMIRDIVENSEKEFDNWVIQPLTDRVKSMIWYGMRSRLQLICTELDGGHLNDSLYDKTVPFVKRYDF
jgi:hypothetical protein